MPANGQPRGPRTTQFISRRNRTGGDTDGAGGAGGVRPAAAGASPGAEPDEPARGARRRGAAGAAGAAGGGSGGGSGGASSGQTKGKGPSLDLTGLAGIWAMMHIQLARVTDIPELAMSETDAKTFFQ